MNAVGGFKWGISILLLALAACSSLPSGPPERPPEQRTVTNTVYVPSPVLCFNEADRPPLPVATPIDPETATRLQLAAAEAADALAWQIYGEKVDRLFLGCMKSTTGVLTP